MFEVTRDTVDVAGVMSERLPCVPGLFPGGPSWASRAFLATVLVKRCSAGG